MSIIDPSRIFNVSQSDVVDNDIPSLQAVDRVRMEQAREIEDAQRKRAQAQAFRQERLRIANQQQQGQQQPANAFARPQGQMPPQQAPPQQQPMLQNYGQLEAQDAVKAQQIAEAKDVMGFYTPTIEAAKAMGEEGNAYKDAIAAALVNTGNPYLAQTGELLKKAKFNADGETVIMGADIKAMPPEQRKNWGFTGNPESLGDRDTVHFKGSKGQTRVVDIKREPSEKSTKTETFETGLTDLTGESMNEWVKANKDKFANPEVYADAKAQADRLASRSAKEKKIYRESVKIKRDSDGKIVGFTPVEKNAPAQIIKIESGGGTPGAGSGKVVAWDSKDGIFGGLVKSENGVKKIQDKIIIGMQALAKNRNTRFYMGKYGAQQDEEFKNRIYDYMTSHDISPDALEDAKAASAALTEQKKRQAQFQQNAGVAERGFKQLEALRTQGDISTNAIPLLNQTVNLLKDWTGDEYPGAAQGIMTETLMDYAKVVSGQTSVAGVTAHAQKMAESLLKLKDNPVQFQKKIAEYRKLMQSRLSEQGKVVQALRSAAGMSPSEDRKEESAPAPDKFSDPSSSNPRRKAAVGVVSALGKVTGQKARDKAIDYYLSNGWKAEELKQMTREAGWH